MALTRIAVFPERCIAAGNCYEIAAAYFDQDPDDGSVVLLREDLDPADEEAVRRAVSACPVAAIELLD
jgi:ferredoxin